MAAKKQKYYVVWHGQTPGIYTSWEKCQAQVKNFPNAVYKSFDSKEEAETAYLQGPEKRQIFAARNAKEKPGKSHSGIIQQSISVDAACSGNPGLMEYKGVWTSDRSEIFHFGPVPNGTNNIGEFLAIVHALALLKKKEDNRTPIYTDSKTAMAWVKRKKANTKLKEDHTNHQLFELIHRAEQWLKKNDWNNPLIKWETEIWGEIPADFDRK